MGQVPIDAVSKLREIFRVLIGDSAEEWESQKQQSEFGIKTDLEWTAHLLSIHRRYCTANDGCNLPHYQSNDLSSHTLSWENKPPSPVPVSAPIPSQHRLGPNLSSAATKANITGFYQRPHLPRRVPYSFNRHAQRRRGGTSKTSRYRSNFTAKPSSSAVTPHTVNTEAATSSRIVESEETEEDVIIIKEEPGYEYEEASTEDMYEGVAEYGRAGDYNERVSGESYSVGVMPGFSESEAECAPDPEDFGDGDGVSVKLEGMESKVEEMDGEEQQTWLSQVEVGEKRHYQRDRSVFPQPVVWKSGEKTNCQSRYLASEAVPASRTSVRSEREIRERFTNNELWGADGKYRNEDVNSGNFPQFSDHFSTGRIAPSMVSVSAAQDSSVHSVDEQDTAMYRYFSDDLSGYSMSVNVRDGRTNNYTGSLASSGKNRPIPCEICGRVILNQSNMSKHKRIHMGVKPYVCSVCKKGFSDRSNFVKHMRAKHNM